MASITYVCEKHNDVVLFTEGVEVLEKGAIRIKKPPEYCPKCDRYYYRHECVRKEEQHGQ